MAAMAPPRRDRRRAALDPWLVDLYRSDYDRLVRLAAMLVDDVGTAEELVQDAFVAFATQQGRTPLRDAEAAPPADRYVVASDDHRRMRDALRGLPERQREVLVLRYYGDLSEAEIAAALDISTGGVKTHAHRGLAALGTGLEGS